MGSVASDHLTHTTKIQEAKSTCPCQKVLTVRLSVLMSLWPLFIYVVFSQTLNVRLSYGLDYKTVHYLHACSHVEEWALRIGFKYRHSKILHNATQFYHKFCLRAHFYYYTVILLNFDTISTNYIDLIETRIEIGIIKSNLLLIQVTFA